MKTFTLLLAGFVLSVSAVKAQEQDYSFKENYPVSSPARLTISSHDGNIDVAPAKGDGIEVFYIVKKYNRILKISREEVEKEVALEIIKDQNSLVINARYKTINQGFNFKDRMSVSFKIYVPKETSCDLTSADGNISLEGVTSTQRCKTSDGNVDIADVTGDVTGKTSDGNIKVNRINGSVKVSTSDGNIHLNDIQGDVQSATSDGNIDLFKIAGNTSARTSDGHISFKELSGSFNANTSDGSVRGNIVALKKQLSINTGDGNIDVTIPSNLGLDLDIKGESIHVPLTNFSGKSEDKVIQGKTNGGGIAVMLSTSDGNVTLKYL
jgi:DUF4097 and DUF4098 domain-containing protein YvlB